MPAVMAGPGDRLSEGVANAGEAFLRRDLAAVIEVRHVKCADRVCRPSRDARWQYPASTRDWQRQVCRLATVHAADKGFRIYL